MHPDLLEQARLLALADPRGAPRQANLRRAVSATYYAVFHFLIDQACRAIVGGQHNQRGFRSALGRAFVHATMKNACSSFGGTQLPETVLKSLPKDRDGKFPIPEAIKSISAMFKELQEKRHLADYDLSERFRRSEVLFLIEQTRQNIEAFENLAATNERQFFLICLLSWRELVNR